jgi:antitoxin HigA-1
MATRHKTRPAHPGHILRVEFMEPGGISRDRLSQASGLSSRRIGDIIGARRPLTAETALRLEAALGMSAQTWMNLQIMFDLEQAALTAGRRIRETTERLNLRDVA